VDTIDWLLNSDPAIRWQAMRDLLEAAFRWDEAFGKEPLFEGEVEPWSRRQADGRWLFDRALLRWYESTPQKIPVCISGPK